ncbi:WSC domain-containing protein [Hypoxylon sp. FL1857]|nr:WSC domain-containing protein [Hypoxylon sp. FL1857]
MAPSVLRLTALLFAAPFFSNTLAQELPPQTITTTYLPTPVQTDSVTNITMAPRQEEGANGLHVIDDDPVYRYAGCWSETTPLPTHTRALDGPHLTVPGLMRVQPCLDYCGFARNKFSPDERGYRYAGLEFAQECWCGDTLSNYSSHLVDSACDVPCDGANTTVCGGHLAITLYDSNKHKHKHKHKSGHGEVPTPDPPNPPNDEAALKAVGVGILMLAVTFAFV